MDDKKSLPFRSRDQRSMQDDLVRDNFAELFNLLRAPKRSRHLSTSDVSD